MFVVALANFSTRFRLLACLFAALLVLAPAAGRAQSVDAQAPTASEAAPSHDQASLSRAAARGLTLKIATTLKKLVIYSAGTGSIASGGVLAAITTASSYSIYVANEYLWDKYRPEPKPTAADGEAFDAGSSLWRNAKKYLTLKPVGMAVTWGLIYAYTGSWTSTVAMGGLSSLTGPVVYFGNNMAWDWYDWYSGTSNAPRPEVPAEPPAPTRFHAADCIGCAR